MSDLSFVALTTYGREMSTDPATRRRIPTLKCTPVTAGMLAALYVQHARQIPHRPGQTYRYVALTPMPSLKRDFLVLRLTTDEISRVERISRQTALSWTYLWRDSHWWEFPTLDYPDYRDARHTSSTMVPRFPPTAAPCVTLSHHGDVNPVTTAGTRISIEQSGGWWWISGDTYPVRDRLSAAGAKWSKQRRQWYYVGTTLPSGITSLAEPQAPAVVALASEATVHGQPVAVTSAEPPSRHLALLAETPSVDADVSANAMPATAEMLGTLPLKYVGHVNVVGDCFCFGLAVEYTPETHRAFPVYLNLCGAATSVEAAWAKLAQGKELTVTPLARDATPVYLHPPEKGLYVRVQRKLDGLGMDNLILLHRQLAQPRFTDAEVAFLLAPDETVACLRLVEYVRHMVKIAMFPAWGAYLRQQGQRAGLLTVRSACESLPVWTVSADSAGWTEVICDGLRRHEIALP